MTHERLSMMLLSFFLTPPALAPGLGLGSDLIAACFERARVHSQVFDRDFATANFIVITKICFLFLPLKALTGTLTAASLRPHSLPRYLDDNSQLAL
jgi:hypothetical protein